MMKTRPEIKETAKANMKQNQGQCVAVLLILSVITVVLVTVAAGVGAMLLVPVISIAANGYFVRTYRGFRDTVSDWFSDMFNNFGRRLGGYYWMGLFIYLWSMLFMIPGIVKGIAYSLTPYILADCPNVKARDALKLSMRMTQGYKADIFVTMLSFLGWLILSAFTFGILEIVYVGPYMNTTLAGVYEELKNNAIENGTISQEELNGGTLRQF